MHAAASDMEEELSDDFIIESFEGMRREEGGEDTILHKLPGTPLITPDPYSLSTHP